MARGKSRLRGVYRRDAAGVFARYLIVRVAESAINGDFFYTRLAWVGCEAMRNER